MRPSKALTAAVLALMATPLAGAHFTTTVPAVVPSVDGWERITGDLELRSPRVAVQYEFYVNPARPATYEVVRYRITNHAQRAGERPYPTTEKLQWDRDGRDLRRFECIEDAAGAKGCAWQEMEKGSDDYLREVGVLLWLYGEHHKITQTR